MSLLRVRGSLEGDRLERARFWTSIHGESLVVLESALVAMRRLMAGQGPLQRRDSELSDLPVLVADIALVRERLAYWSGGSGKLG